MKIGVISDTHIPKAALDLPEEIYAVFKNVDLILHAGDLVELQVVDNLKTMAPVRAVHGNMDFGQVRNVLPKKDIIEIGEFRIGLIHGYGTPKNIIGCLKEEFDKNINAIVFGHTHIPCNEKIDKTLFFNPGSPTDRVFAAYNSYGIIDVNTDISGRIIKMK